VGTYKPEKKAPDPGLNSQLVRIPAAEAVGYDMPSLPRDSFTAVACGPPVHIAVYWNATLAHTLGFKILTLGCPVLDAFQGRGFWAVPRIQINSER
jgi:hypothetical protein